MGERPQSASTWIIGYGNPHRRDDGLGPYVVNRLCEDFHSEARIAFCSLHQLDVVLADELQMADLVILVDATVEDLERGIHWRRVQRETELSPCGMHHFKPSMLLSLLETLYQRSPCIWLVSVQGSDFGFGEGLSLEAQEKADRASLEIARFCRRKLIDKEPSSVNDVHHGSQTRRRAKWRRGQISLSSMTTRTL